MVAPLKRNKMNVLTKAALAGLKAITLTKFCFIFTLRQGTIMIASVELSLSTFAVILLLLCLTHANNLVDMVTADIRQFENHLWFQKGDNEAPSYIVGNEKKMLSGQHLALILKVIVLGLLLIVSIYFLTTFLLMYGAVRRCATHLVPWMSVAFINLVTVLFWFLPFCYFLLENYCAVACICLLIVYPGHVYAWLTVFSYYRQLTSKNFNNVAYVADKMECPQMISTCKFSSFKIGCVLYTGASYKPKNTVFFCVLISFYEIGKCLGMPLTTNVTPVEEDTTDEFVFSVMPLKIILEQQLQAVKASKRSNLLQAKPEMTDKNLKLVVKTSVKSPPKSVCTEAELRKKASPEDISKIFSGDVKFEEDESRLQKIYDSVKDCQFVKVRTSKLWGPVWHCLNRLFLFFLFG